MNGFLKGDVEDELRWDPDIDATDEGVLGVANDLEMRLPAIHQKPEGGGASEPASAFGP